VFAFLYSQGSLMSAISPECTVVLQIDGLHIAHLRLVLRDWSTAISAGVTLVCDEEGECKTDFLRLLAAELPYAAGRLNLQGVAQHVDISAYRQQVFWIEPSTAEYDEFTVEGFFPCRQVAMPVLIRLRCCS
jgi:ABC-type Na+ transport system ATPase subunit NatA